MLYCVQSPVYPSVAWAQLEVSPECKATEDLEIGQVCPPKKPKTKNVNTAY